MLKIPMMIQFVAGSWVPDLGLCYDSVRLGPWIAAQARPWPEALAFDFSLASDKRPRLRPQNNFSGQATGQGPG